jgi:hypothetical protein
VREEASEASEDWLLLRGGAPRRCARPTWEEGAPDTFLLVSEGPRLGEEAEEGMAAKPRLRSAASMGEVSRDDDWEAALEVRALGAAAPEATAEGGWAGADGKLCTLVAPMSELPR